MVLRGTSLIIIPFYLKKNPLKTIHPQTQETLGGRNESVSNLDLEQQEVKVGDRLSANSQEFQFTGKSVCQFSNLKLIKNLESILT